LKNYSIVHHLYDEFDSWDIGQQDYLDSPLNCPSSNYYTHFNKENLLLAYGGDPKIEVFVEADNIQDAFNKGYELIFAYEKEHGIEDVNEKTKEIDNILGFLDDKDYDEFHEKYNINMDDGRVDIKYLDELKEFYEKYKK
jgi:hypothetical protein